jgi:glycosyltransferase involved in cell wall biosynthesis
MPQPQKTKICLVGDCLSGGGAERVHAFLSEYFAAKGIEVHNVVVQDRVTYDFSGELLNLGLLKDERNGFSNKLKRFSVLRKYIKKHDFDYVIDFRMRRKYLQDLLISRLVFTVPTVYTVHHYIIKWYMPKKPWLTKLIYGKAYGVISITDKIKELIEREQGLKNVTNIYNPVNLGYINKKLNDDMPYPGYRYIVAAGRMEDDNIKQFDKLIAAYADSVLPANDIKLVILGQGSEKDNLVAFSHEKGVGDKVIFKGFQENPYVYMRNALLYALTSKNEGLPMVLLESLACGTPVVAFDCYTGPSEIVIHKVNGLLIDDQDVEKFTEGLNLMFTDKELYEKCRQNAVSSIAKFSLETIGAQWMDFLKIQN